MYIFKTDSEKFQLNANYANALRVADNGALYGVGSKTKPVYFLNGIPNECDTYGGGTAVTLNGASKAASTASFYAPAGAGTSGQVLTSSGAAPGWTNQANLNVGSAAKWTNKRTLSIQGSVTGSAEIDGSGDITLNTITNHTHLYAGSSTAGGVANSALKLNNTTAIGSDNVPVYFTNAGVPTPCKGDLSLNTTGSAAKWTTARTITLAGSVTGSVSLDGSANVTLNTTTNHSHNYAGSSSAGGSANSAVKLDSSAGSTGQAIYFASGQPAAIDWRIGNSGVGEHNCNNIAYNFCGYYTTNGPATSIGATTADGAIWSQAYSTSWVAQIAQDYRDGDLFVRGKNNGTWTAWKRIWATGDAVTSAVWNDYAECRESDCEEFGYVLMEVGDDSLTKTTERLSHFAGVSSDTWGFSQGETDKAKTPIAVAGRVLVYPYQNRNNYRPGDCVCAAPGGTVDIMTREEVIQWPDRIVGTVSCVPDYEEWGGGESADRDPVKVNGRIWIKVR